MRLPFAILGGAKKVNQASSTQKHGVRRRSLAIDCLEDRLVPIVQPVGPEVIVNDVTSGSQRQPSVAMNNSGEFAVAWYSEGGTPTQIRLERFSPETNLSLGEVSLTTSQPGVLPSIAIDDDGRVAAAYALDGQLPDSTSDVFVRLVSNRGIPSATQSLVNTQQVNAQNGQDVTFLSDGGFVVAWFSSDGPQNTSLRMQRFANNGQAIGIENRVDVPGSGFRLIDRLTIDATPDGGFIVAWHEFNQSDVQRNMARWYDANGLPLDLPQVINSASSNSLTEIDLGVDQNGNALFAWRSGGARSDGGQPGIYYRSFRADRTPIGPDSLLSTDAGWNVFALSVDVSKAGKAIIAWDSQPSGNPFAPSEIRARRLQSDGSVVGPTFRVDTVARSNSSPSVGINDAGEFAVVWQARNISETNDDVYLRWYRDQNQAPVALSATSYSVVEGGQVTLDGGLSLDPDGSIASFSWDVNGDGTFGDATGVNPTLTWPQLVALGIADGPGSFDVRVRVTDAEGAVSTSPSGQSTLTVQNVAPTLSVAAASQQPNPASITLNVTDPSPVDQAANFTFMIDWENDGVFEETVSLPNGSTVTHAYPLAQANYTVAVKAMDKDGGVSNTVTRNIQTRRLLVVGGVAYWSGSAGADKVRFVQEAGDPTRVRIIETLANGVPSSFNTVQSGITSGIIVASGVGGNDEIDASGLTVTFANLSGGDGSDSVIGGGGSDTVDGGSSADTIRGGGGNDVITGGTGDDLIYGEYPTSTGFSTKSKDLGSDIIDGGDGADTIYGDGDGGEGTPDSILGGSGNDIIYGDGTAGDAGAADTIYGGADDDLIYGEPDGAEGAIDRLYGESGQDTIYASGGNDFVFGGDGDDILLGGDGAEGAADSMDGGSGRDILVGDTGRLDVNGNLNSGGADTLRGGTDDDIIISSMILATATNILIPIQSEWRSSERNYETRVDNVLGFGFGPRNNGDSFLLPGDNIRDDEFTDRVFGDGGLDLFLVDIPTEDLIADLAGEQVIEL